MSISFYLFLHHQNLKNLFYITSIRGERTSRNANIFSDNINFSDNIFMTERLFLHYLHDIFFVLHSFLTFRISNSLTTWPSLLTKIYIFYLIIKKMIYKLFSCK